MCRGPIGVGVARHDEYGGWQERTRTIARLCQLRFIWSSVLTTLT